MIAVLPPWLQDLKEAWPMVISVVGVLVAAWRQIRRKVFDPIAKTQKLVEYHLGPNGKTTPIHVRLIALEHAHNIEHHTEADQ
jgi:hypothetical protein